MSTDCGLTRQKSSNKIKNNYSDQICISLRVHLHLSIEKSTTRIFHWPKFVYAFQNSFLFMPVAMQLQFVTYMLALNQIICFYLQLTTS